MLRIPLAYLPGTPDWQKLMRTEDGRLVTARMVRDGKAVGERLRLATHLSVAEFILWKLKIIK